LPPAARIRQLPKCSLVPAEAHRGAALRPDWHARILTGFLAFCTRRTRVPQRDWGRNAQDSPGYQLVSAHAPVWEKQRRILAGFLHICSRKSPVPVRVRGDLGLSLRQITGITRARSGGKSAGILAAFLAASTRAGRVPLRVYGKHPVSVCPRGAWYW
jgi:hypothetical protein